VRATAAADGPQRGIKEAKRELMVLLTQGTGLKGAADTRNAAQVGELLLVLEAMNPTPAPAGSALLNGAWELLYTGGYSKGFVDSPTRELALLLYTSFHRPGLLSRLADRLPDGLVDVDFVNLKISPDEPRVQGTLKAGVAGNVQDLVAEGTLVQRSPVRLTETFTRARALGQAIDIPGPFTMSRELFVTFLDEDFLVARDESGVPDVWLRQLSVFDAPAAANEIAEAPGAVAGEPAVDAQALDVAKEAAADLVADEAEEELDGEAGEEEEEEEEEEEAAGKADEEKKPKKKGRKGKKSQKEGDGQ